MSRQLPPNTRTFPDVVVKSKASNKSFLPFAVHFCRESRISHRSACLTNVKGRRPQPLGWLSTHGTLTLISINPDENTLHGSMFPTFQKTRSTLPGSTTSSTSAAVDNAQVTELTNLLIDV